MVSLQDVSRGSRQLASGWLWRATHFLPLPPPADFEADVANTVRRVRRHTLTTPRRVATVCDGTEHIARSGIPGAIVECGVWRGGSLMAAALTLLRLGDRERDLYGFDTFAGMPAPTEEDERSLYDGYSPLRRWRRGRREDGNDWHHVPVEDVRERLLATGYDPARLHLVPGMVEDTLPGEAPEQIALLRIDTDWYRSTRHILEQLYPRLRPGGVLILDDYGHYAGVRKAVDEYFAEAGDRPLLTRIDYTGRLAVKP